MPAAALKALTERLEHAQVFLEYGSGGSTVLAAKMGVGTIVSVESSVDWVDSVRSAASHHAGTLHLLLADIGKTGDWGRPVDRKAVERWHLYPEIGWRRLRELGLSPDVVLIDGRFRVACFCVSLLSSNPGTVLLFDDYVDRKQYHVVEEFCQRTSLHDRMAEFRVPERMDAGAVVACLLAHVHEAD